MLTMRASAALLASAKSPAGLLEVVAAAGLGREPEPLDADALEGLGLPRDSSASLAAGVGSLRTLLIVQRDQAPLRLELQRCARRLQSRAPHVLWIVAAIDAAGAQGGIVAWHGGVGAPRMASFQWETSHVVDSDAETLCALSALRADSDVALHTRVLDVLGREGLTRRFYRALEAHVSAMSASLAPVDPREARELALLTVSRLLFVRFLESKGWLNGERDFLASRFEEAIRAGGRFHRQTLLPLFFGTLNTPYRRRAERARRFGRIPFLNGGLFSLAQVERRRRAVFSDETLGGLLQHVLLRYRFTAREDSASWSEASVDPEMLGRAFESLMASDERRATGVFYTPHALVARLTDLALEPVARGDLLPLQNVRVLDPACGSGAFLVHVLERLAGLRQRAGERNDIAGIRRAVLARSVFGVDRNPTAVWLCELRLWLSVVIESEIADPMKVEPLPNLDRNIRVGDALDGPAFAAPGATIESARIAELRSRYVRATGARKECALRQIDRLERWRAMHAVERAISSTQAARRELHELRQAFDLFGERARPSEALMREFRHLRGSLRRLRLERQRLRDGGALAFSFVAMFAEAHAAGGFDVVVGNPPWVRLHRIPVELRERLKREYDVFRSAQWESGAQTARAAPGFASQVDLSALFVERSIRLLRPNGTAALLLPAKLWRSLAGGGVRQLLATRTRVTHLADVAESARSFDAVVYPSLLVARTQHGLGKVQVAVHEPDRVREWSAALRDLAFDGTAGAPWVMLHPEARRGFDLLRSAGTALGTSAFGAPRLGVKTGCNAAFIVRRLRRSRGLVTIVDSSGEDGAVEEAVLRPALRGDELRAFRRKQTDTSIIWTHDAVGALRRLPERTRAWLQRRYGALAARADATGSKRWWSLFRTEAADASQPRVVWSDFGRRPRALVLRAGDPTVPLNTCYVIRCNEEDDAWALAAILNSDLAAAWLNALAEPARGGYRRYLGWTIGQLPIPPDWASARVPLARAAVAVADGSTDHADLTAAVLGAYDVAPEEMTALLESVRCD